MAIILKKGRLPKYKEPKPQKVKCRNCKSLIQYAREDLDFHYYDYDDLYEDQIPPPILVCPFCGNHIDIYLKD